MSLLPTSTMMTNELKLHDFKGTKASLTFGDANINDGYSYLRINFRANDLKFDFWQDKPVINFIADEEITFNDKKIWHENNDGPMSGLHADLLDGLHASEFKDRNGHHHFGHAFLPGGNKKFVKIATFTPRRVGVPPDFNTNGTAPFQGIFADNIVKSMQARATFEAFIDDTPEGLGPIGFNGFEHTDMSSEGVYNSTLRASVSMLRKGDTNGPPWQGGETVDIHIGIFEDPTNQDNNGWSCTSRYFYLSCHERNLPLIKEPDDVRHDYLIGGNVLPIVSGTMAFAAQEFTTAALVPSHSCPVTVPGHEDDLDRPPVDYSDYATPYDPTKNNYMAQKFPEIIPPGFSYQKEMESYRLYHVDSQTLTLDGVQVVEHKFELYMAVDTKMEVHVQPYMSSSCLFYNYQKPLTESELPDGPYMRPRSIYDNRYSHVEHRHQNYEQKMESMDSEIEQIWSSFDNYVVIGQGSANKNKVLMTNELGRVVAVKDNIERHQDSRRKKRRVLITDDNGCIVESWIQTKELAQLKDVRANIQHQLDDLYAGLEAVPPTPVIPDVTGFVKKTGDTMTGDLTMLNGKTFVAQSANGARKGGFYCNDTAIALWDYQDSGTAWKVEQITRGSYNSRLFRISKNEFMVSGIRVTVGGSAPQGTPSAGDIWIKNT